jgi:hypothetical protein
VLSYNPGQGLIAGFYMLRFRARVPITAAGSVEVVLKIMVDSRVRIHFCHLR